MGKVSRPFNARKRFGQNFLVDPGVIAKICDSLGLKATDQIVEIGPGYGALTKHLLPIVQQMQVIELDRDLIPHLQLNCDPLGKLTIHQADALQFDFSKLMTHDKPIRIVGNLPYNISTPLLFHLLQFLDGIVDMHFMLQFEVVARMTALPNTNDYGRLSVMLQYFCELEYLFRVPPSAFNPAPKIDSAIVRLKPHSKIKTLASDFALFTNVVRSAFNLRRKTLRNSLKNYLDESDWQQLSIDSQLRAENLSVADFVVLTNYIAAQQ